MRKTSEAAQGLTPAPMEADGFKGVYPVSVYLRGVTNRRKRDPKGQWSTAEDEQLVVLVRQYGTKNWSMISTQIPGRFGEQVRASFSHRQLDRDSRLPATPRSPLFTEAQLLACLEPFFCAVYDRPTHRCFA